MTQALLNPPGAATEAVELVPQYFDPALIVTPDDNPVYSPQQLADLLESMRDFQQLVPGWVAPAPHLRHDQRLCLEGNRRLSVCRLLGLPFWAFDQGRFVPEEERIRLTFQHNLSRRVMGREEIVQRAARFMELTDCTLAQAAKPLNLSVPMLSKLIGERRILPELRERTDRLALSVRFLISAVPPARMAEVVAYAEQPGTTRDQVAAFIRRLKADDKPGVRPPRPLTLRIGHRTLTLSVSDTDTAHTVAEDLKAVIGKLGKHADVPPEGWPFLFA
jgi:hypothetical protein